MMLSNVAQKVGFILLVFGAAPAIGQDSKTPTGHDAVELIADDVRATLDKKAIEQGYEVAEDQEYRKAEDYHDRNFWRWQREMSRGRDSEMQLRASREMQLSTLHCEQLNFARKAAHESDREKRKALLEQADRARRDLEAMRTTESSRIRARAAREAEEARKEKERRDREDRAFMRDAVRQQRQEEREAGMAAREARQEARESAREAREAQREARQAARVNE